MGWIASLKLKNGNTIPLCTFTRPPSDLPQETDISASVVRLGLDGTRYKTSSLLYYWTLKNDNRLGLQWARDDEGHVNPIQCTYVTEIYPDYITKGAATAYKDGKELEYVGVGLWVDEDTHTATMMTVFRQDGRYYAGGRDNGVYEDFYGSESDSTDPYDDDNPAGGGGGDGDPDQSTDPIDFPDLPSISATDTGFITLYNPSLGELKSLATYLWTNWNDLEANWSKMFVQPMDAILGLSIVPFNVPEGLSVNVKFGNLVAPVAMTIAAQQYIEIDCGTLTIPEYWGAYLDYDPYTKIQLFLPMIGIHDISADEVIGKPVHIKYHIDILSGACVAYVKCTSSVLYEFNGQCATEIPVTGNDFSALIEASVRAAGAVVGAVASGGATALGASAAMSDAVMSAKPNYQRSGTLSSAAGLLGNRKPYFLITRPRQCLPAYQNKFIGYPSYQTRTLSDCQGYTEVESIHLENIPATEEEKTEIMRLLLGGVII